MTKRRKITNPGVTIRSEEEDRHTWINPRTSVLPKSLGVRIHKGYYGLVGEEYDPLSTTVVLHFDKNEDLILRLGQELNPYLNRILVTPPRVRIPAAMLGFKSYVISTEANLRGDFVFMWGEQEGRINYFAFNVAAIGLFDGVDELCMDGTFSMFGQSIGQLDFRHGVASPFFITGELAHGEQFHLFDQFVRSSGGSGYELAHRIDFGGTPKVTGFLCIDMSVGHDRAPISRADGVEQARSLFSELDL